MDIYERLEKEFKDYPIGFTEGDGGLIEAIPKDYSIYRGRIGYWDSPFGDLVKSVYKFLKEENIKPRHKAV